MALFDNARSVVLNDKVVKSIKTTDGGVIYEKTNDTYLTIDVPLSLIYSDAFSITGALTDYQGNGLNGKSVDLLVGSTVVDSTTTTTNGAYSFTSTPVRTGNHEFKVVFNGDSSYDSSESVTVSRVIGKETSVIVNNTDMSKIGFDYSNDYANKHIEFFLKTDDGEVIANASAKVDHMSVHTDNNGYCNGIFITDPSSTIITYAGDENYSPCSLTLQFVRQVPTVIQVTGDSVIQKEESTTLTVTVLDQDGDVIPNCTLSYSAVNGSTDVASGTLARTDNNGQTSVSYTGTGIGDVDFTFTYNANGTLLQKTFVLEDCDTYDTTEYTKSYSTTKFETIASITDLSDVSISLDLKTTTYNYSCVFGVGYNSESDQIGFGTTDLTYSRIYRTLNGTNNHSNYSEFNQNNVYYNLRFERVGNTLKTYLNNVLIDTFTDNEISTFKYLNLGSWRTKTIYYKNLKVKAL